MECSKKEGKKECNNEHVKKEQLKKIERRKERYKEGNDKSKK